MSKEEFNGINRVYSPRKTSAVYKGYPKIKVCKQAVQKIRSVQKPHTELLHAGDFKIEVEIYGKIRGDIDNVLKGVLDSLNGYAYKDDRQCVDARVVIYKS